MALHLNRHPYRGLTRRGFRAWLESLYNEPVGAATKPCDCPVARYLNSGFALGDRPYISVHAVSMQIGDDSYPLPLWAILAIENIDRTRLAHGLTGASVARILDARNFAEVDTAISDAILAARKPFGSVQERLEDAVFANL